MSLWTADKSEQHLFRSSQAILAKNSTLTVP